VAEEPMLMDKAWGDMCAANEHGAARLYRFARPTNPDPEWELRRRSVDAWSQFGARVMSMSR
jgi:hypothetical protein